MPLPYEGNTMRTTDDAVRKRELEKEKEKTFQFSFLIPLFSACQLP